MKIHLNNLPESLLHAEREAQTLLGSSEEREIIRHLGEKSVSQTQLKCEILILISKMTI